MKNNNNDLQSHKELCFEPSLFDGGCAGEDILCILFKKKRISRVSHHHILYLCTHCYNGYDTGKTYSSTLK